MNAYLSGLKVILVGLALAMATSGAQAQTRLTPWSAPQGYSTPGFHVSPEGEVRHHMPRRVQNPDNPDCFCWANGRKVAEGLSACINTAEGRRLAACGRVSNMMSWDVTRNPCPDA